MLVDLRNKEHHRQGGARRRSTRRGITVNKNTVPKETAVAVRHERHPPRNAGGYDARDEGAGDGADRLFHQPGHQ